MLYEFCVSIMSQAYPSVTLGTLTGVACGTIVHNNKTQVASGNTQSNSRFVYDQHSQDTTEVSRNATVLGASGQGAHVELSTLVTVDGEKNAAGNKVESDEHHVFLSARRVGREPNNRWVHLMGSRRVLSVLVCQQGISIQVYGEQRSISFDACAGRVESNNSSIHAQI